MKENILISLKNIVVEFDGQRILKGINLDIHDEEFVTFLGPSGCGKTTTLRIIGGFVEPNQGEIYFDGKKINGVPPYKRNVNTVFQRYALFPHLNVFDNVAFGLNIKKMDKKVIEQKVRSMLKMVGLVGFENRNINQLSGGQQQRVAIARALVNEPKVLLLDEPLGALDLKLRKEMQGELMRIQKSLKITFIYVTHDQEEALTMSDRVVVMKDGEIQQIGTPQDIYNEPKNAFVADFIGESNITASCTRTLRWNLPARPSSAWTRALPKTSVSTWSSDRRTLSSATMRPPRSAARWNRSSLRASTMKSPSTPTATSG